MAPLLASRVEDKRYSLPGAERQEMGEGLLTSESTPVAGLLSFPTKTSGAASPTCFSFQNKTLSITTLYTDYSYVAPKVPLLCSLPKLETTQNCRGLPHSSSTRGPRTQHVSQTLRTCGDRGGWQEIGFAH